MKLFCVLPLDVTNWGGKLEGDSGSKLEGALLLGTRCHHWTSLTSDTGSKLLLFSMCNYYTKQQQQHEIISTTKTTAKT